MFGGSAQAQPKALPTVIYHQRFISLPGQSWGPYTTARILNFLSQQGELAWVGHDHRNSQEWVIYTKTDKTLVEVKFPAYSGNGWLHVSSHDEASVIRFFEEIRTIIEAISASAQPEVVTLDPDF